MEREELKRLAIEAIEASKDELIGIGRHIMANPETGFREVKTSVYLKSILEGCGLDVRDKIALTGVKAKAAGRKHEVNVAVMGEMDALLMPTHAGCDPVTGAFHGCGHHAQLTTIIGVCFGLVRSGLMKELDGDLTFIGIPAEEVIESAYRRSLIDQGRLHFVSGKQEFIYLGEFDDVDMVLCSHIMGQTAEPHAWAGHSWNGVLHKSVRYIGKSAHAGLAPERGINALEAALCGMNNINAMRESFSEKDCVRIHYIITKGGSSPNIVPDDIRIEGGVRASTVEAMFKVNERVNRAFRMGAESVGAGIEIDDSAGYYLPCHQSEPLGEVYLRNAREILGAENVENVFGQHRGSSTDCGDVASLIPLLHPYFGGAVGAPHGADFDIVNEEAAYVYPAKIAAATIIDLLNNNAEKAKQIKDNFVPSFTSREDYLACFNKFKQEDM